MIERKIERALEQSCFDVIATDYLELYRVLVDTIWQPILDTVPENDIREEVWCWKYD